MIAAESIEWPPTFIDQPEAQFRLLHGKYVERKQGRNSLPRNIQELWASHKYSVMARDPATYKKIGKLVASSKISFDNLSEKLVLPMRTSPARGRLENAISHMWKYVADYSPVDPQRLTCSELLDEIQEKSQKYTVEYLLRFTALGDLKLWCN